MLVVLANSSDFPLPAIPMWIGFSRGRTVAVGNRISHASLLILLLRIRYTLVILRATQ